jgi:hypothetical protein
VKDRHFSFALRPAPLFRRQATAQKPRAALAKQNGHENQCRGKDEHPSQLGALTARGVLLEIADVCRGQGGGDRCLRSWRSLAKNARRGLLPIAHSSAFARQTASTEASAFDGRAVGARKQKIGMQRQTVAQDLP